MITIRSFQAQDAAAILALAPRLTIGTAAWRDPDAVASAVQGWVRSAIEEASATPDRLLVAEQAADGAVAGFLSVSEHTHWAGGRDAYIGELVVAPEHERQGVATALVQAAVDWARAAGLERISVSTGAANARAVGLYEHLGFHAEDVTLSARVER